MIKRIFNKLGISRTYSIQLMGKKVKVPIWGGMGFSNLNDAEPWMNILLQKLGSNNTRFLDVGVNVGQTLLKWKTLFPDSEYVGFEPNVDCVYYVQDLVEKNGFSNCRLYPYAISTEKISNELYLLGTDRADSSATTIPNFRKDEERVAVQIESLPLSEIDSNPFDLIKIDVEGAELGVLESIFDLNCKAPILCEVLPVYNNKNKDRLNRQLKIEALLSRQNYVIYRIIKGASIQLNKIEGIGIHGNMDACDYLFLPKSKEEAIIAKFN